MFSKALAKAPADRYDNCIDFANALAGRLGTVAAETGATDADHGVTDRASAASTGRVPQRAKKAESAATACGRSSR